MQVRPQTREHVKKYNEAAWYYIKRASEVFHQLKTCRKSVFNAKGSIFKKTNI